MPSTVTLVRRSRAGAAPASARKAGTLPPSSGWVDGPRRGEVGQAVYGPNTDGGDPTPTGYGAVPDFDAGDESYIVDQ